ncbi:TPA: hypothetical protein I9007_000682 [Clostridium perfringens]|uniref:hypothetical protein n=1 Tax=Clostridium perfringens TaxID=1502 RepID=UPI001A190B74|nr:hypothetical protein [Clostridium perfringens]WFB43572.1 hypothetical protein P6X90_07285 [Clostridium perfringens]WFD75139.1 hypothetical protein P6978_07285 [Clostridium perfringens]HAT4185202.1 hypothetical protein [Clostridium perfringens]HAT4187776.1 hypothetical protein [Clostridium perfringens]HAT4194180.1 hypothetical protein [Clostridium perfringens]
MFFDNKLTEEQLEKEDVLDIIYIYLLIKKYIENINERILNVLNIDQEEKEESAFDDYDEEYGYNALAENEEIEKDIYDSYLNILNIIFKLAKNELNMNIKESYEIDIYELLDYLDFELKNRENIQTSEEI